MSEILCIDGICSIGRAVPPVLFSAVELCQVIPAREGTLVIARVLESKEKYNRLELISGETVQLQKGGVYVFVLGNRSALDGYVGRVPERVRIGDTLQVLNLGGICGICESYNHTIVGKPFDIQVLGAVGNEQGKAVNISDHAPVHGAHTLTVSQPLIMVYGTCMNVGKTAVACSVIASLTRGGMRVAGAKLTGAGCLKDTLAMRDHGAVATLDLVDAGFTSTVTKKHTVFGAKGLVNTLAQMEVDAIVVEIGDGVISQYHGRNVLFDPEFRCATVLGIACAHDLTGAWGLKVLAQRYHFRLDMMSGRVTDTTSGSGYITDKWRIPAVNALTHTEAFHHMVRTFISR